MGKVMRSGGYTNPECQQIRRLWGLPLNIKCRVNGLSLNLMEHIHQLECMNAIRRESTAFSTKVYAPNIYPASAPTS